jgi:hypothetical protein
MSRSHGLPAHTDDRLRPYSGLADLQLIARGAVPRAGICSAVPADPPYHH